MASQNITSKFSDTKLKLVSFNMRGMRNNKKRRTLFHLFRKNKYDIICLQESHLLQMDSELIEKEWGPKFHLAEGTTRSKGLLTLFGNNVQISEFSLVKQNDRCLTSRLMKDGLDLTILNVYAPCVDSEKGAFLNSINSTFRDLQSSQDSSFIILGDFNMVLDNELDVISGECHNEKIVKYFNNFVNELLLVDIWRLMNGKKREFTWSKKNPFIARRLDYLLTSELLIPFCKNCHISEMGFSDHKAVTLNIDFSSFQRGPSYYKFNVSLLHDEMLVKEINSEIERIKMLDLEPHLKWEYIKVSIKDIANSYGRALARENRKFEKMLISELKELENHITNFPNDFEALNLYSELKKKRELMTLREAEGARIRSGQKWAQEGEKCTKYFLNLEKLRSNSNTIFSLEDTSGDKIQNPENILDQIKCHFENVYKEPLSYRESDLSFVNDGKGNIIEMSDKVILNKELSIDELFNALKKSNNNSSPGSDGLPCEVYKFFWNQLKSPLLDCYKHSFEKGYLCSSQSQGIICLHHKGKGLSREHLNHWRPISLTNFDYKLLAKTMAIRLNTCINKVVHEDQFAFIKGRQVGDLLREIDDILTYGKLKFPDSMILSLDYAKAFDTISVTAVKKAFTYFGFDGNFMKWVDILLYDRKSCVQNGGYLSEFFVMERGVRQGCPISPLFFIITLELLARDIRKNDLIKGINIGDIHIKIRLYADDATLFLSDIIDYREVLSRIKSFTSFSGLFLNKQKSAAMVIGNTGFKNRIQFGIKYQNKIKILGVTFSNECNANEIAENYDPKIEQLERLCHLWGKRYLTVFGRITILKSFGISLFIYLMQSIGISHENLKRINSILYRFIWNPRANKGKKVIEKVKRDIINKDYESGGLKMIDVIKLQDSFLLKWADRLLNSSKDNWKNIPYIYFTAIGGNSAFMSDVVKSDFKGINLIESPFWKRVLITWLNYKNNELDKTNSTPSIFDPIFNNSYITYKKKVLFNSRCIGKNLIYIKDFLKQGKIISFADFNNLLSNSADSLLIYNLVFNALSKFENQFKKEFEDNNDLENNTSENVNCLFKGLETGKIDRKMFYKIISNSDIESIKELWRELYQIEENDPEIWCLPRECCSETKLLELQWKILHNVYPTGVLLNKMNIKVNNLCEVCGEVDTVVHFFVTCDMIIPVWEEANKMITSYIGKPYKLSERDKIIGIQKSDYGFDRESRKRINQLILVCKSVISKFKYDKTGNVKVLLENQLFYRGLL